MPTLLDGLTDQLVVGNATTSRRVGGAAGKRCNLVNLSLGVIPHAVTHLRMRFLTKIENWSVAVMMEGLLNMTQGRGNYSQITNTSPVAS